MYGVKSGPVCRTVGVRLDGRVNGRGPVGTGVECGFELTLGLDPVSVTVTEVLVRHFKGLPSSSCVQMTICRHDNTSFLTLSLLLLLLLPSSISNSGLVYDPCDGLRKVFIRRARGVLEISCHDKHWEKMDYPFDSESHQLFESIIHRRGLKFMFIQGVCP